VEAAISYAADAGLPARWLLGWSFGTELALKWGLGGQDAGPPGGTGATAPEIASTAPGTASMAPGIGSTDAGIGSRSPGVGSRTPEVGSTAPGIGFADRGIEGSILLSPPLHRATDADLDRWAASGKPLMPLIPALDDYLRPDEARRRFARVPTAEVIAVDGAKHLWVGEPSVRIVMNQIVRRVNPAALIPPAMTLPTHWEESAFDPQDARATRHGGRPSALQPRHRRRP
jgi:hypothetical protein